MSSPPNPQHEPTMEEILASIRKIISEDQAEPEKSATTAPAEPEVLELTNEVKDEDSGGPVAMEAIDQVAQSMRAAPRNERPSVGQEGSEMSQDDLISDNARQALGQAFDALEQEPGQQSIGEEQSMTGSTLDAAFERAVRSAFEPVLHTWVDSRGEQIMDQLKPLIRQWMDDNLPALIENAVRNEIARAVRNRRR